MGTRTRPTLYISKERARGGREGGEEEPADCGRRPLSSPHPLNPAQHFLNDVISFSLALHLHLHLLSPSILAGALCVLHAHAHIRPPARPLDVTHMTKYPASCWGRRDPYKFTAANLLWSGSPTLLSFCHFTISLQCQHSIILQKNTLQSKKPITVSCTHRATKQGDTLCR